jgi:plasmid stabilization system protein ParE
MVYQITFKKRFQNKLEKLLVYIEQEFGLLVAKKFAGEIDNKLTTLQRHPFIGQQSTSHKNVRSIIVENHK